ncbi:MAG: alginate export family protein [Zoogloeaceae bacterium]|jgi:alginate production protein|nr:alginate export family protein [Zoogloeaceae bacterium]
MPADKLIKYYCHGFILSLLGAFPAWAAPPEGDNLGIDARIIARAEDDRDLGSREGGDIHGLSLDLRPWGYFGRGAWSAFTMAQIVSASNSTLPSTDFHDETRRDDSREADNNYLALREFWIGYSGLTAYPGEELRFGRQRLRHEDGLWRDTTVESLSWSLDTTLLRASLGVAERFSEYRSDIHELAPEDRDRLHVFGGVARQWRHGHWVGFDFHHSRDRGHFKRPGEVVDDLDKTRAGTLTWLGLRAGSDAFASRNEQPFNYWASAIWLGGQRKRLVSATVNGQRIAISEQSDDARAWGVDLGLRWRFAQDWQAGLAYAHGGGGGSQGRHDFQQTGLESNRSRFTGVATQVHRFGEAFRGELANLRSASIFASWQARGGYDASVVVHRFWRASGSQPVGDSGISAAMPNDSKDVGEEIDLIATMYFKNGLLPDALGQIIDEPSASLRFRAGIFWPGNAYGRQADAAMYRVSVDVLWRF